MYNLSDVWLEEQIRDRFSFRRFVGLGVVDDVPDATTFCRFRNELLGEKLSEKLFHLILKQLLEKGEFRLSQNRLWTPIPSMGSSCSTKAMPPAQSQR